MVESAPMKPDLDKPEPTAPSPIDLAPRRRSSRIYYAIFVPLGLLGFAISFYVTYQRNEPLQIPSRLRLPALPLPSSSAPPFFEEGPPPSPPTPSR